ncbi:golgin subfamily A member 3 [Thrips palmi]|uniref:Golgin subfamily A member 3 n=1 Tax=Thrips palmi TaxID=161013 RepID=A0A6P8ZIS6_THRPL|nr:golgin subfamily A member 3 [Thrips palmi]
MLRTQLGAQREARRRKLDEVSAEMDRLRAELAAERAMREQLERRLHDDDEDQMLRDAMLVESDQLRDDLEREREARQQVQLQAAAELATSREEGERATVQLDEVQRQATALKEVAALSKRMLAIREAQVHDMRQQLTAIEEKVGSPEHTATTLTHLRSEYEKQITNIRGLKQLYEERARVLQQEKDKQAGELEQRTQEVGELQDAVKELEEKASQLEATLSERSDALEELEFQLGDSVAECQSLTAQMARINGLFTQMLLGCSHPDIDLDRLGHLLHENHDLIADITDKDGGTDIAPVLPKLILDLITQVEEEARLKQEAEEGEEEEVCEDADVKEGEEAVKQEDQQSAEGQVQADDKPADEKPADDKQVGDKTTEDQQPEGAQQNPQDAEKAVIAAAPGREELVNEIASNLPKVWAVLRELVSQQAGRGVRRGSVGDSEKGKASCYTSVNTPGGPRKVISVSKTYIRLKDLIVEKRSLQKELCSLKQLNGHLETRLDEQENRLGKVSSELHKTWGLVGRLQAQHQQLHTHEKILRYELHQKRELLSELKQELEYCREKWESAREKNSQTDREWRVLRREFAARKTRDATRLDDLNNSTSGESGLGEDSGEDDADVSSGRSETPSVAEDAVVTSSLAEEDLVVAAPDLPVDPENAVVEEAAAPAEASAVPIQVSMAPQLEATEDVEMLPLELAPVRAVTSSACRVVTTEPLTATVVRSAAVVLQTEVVPAQRATTTPLPAARRLGDDASDASDSDASGPRGAVRDLTDLKARALVTYAQRVASMRQQDTLQDTLQDTRQDAQQDSQQDSSRDTEEEPDQPKPKCRPLAARLDVSPAPLGTDSRTDSRTDSPPDTPQDTALRPPPTRVVPVFDPLAAVRPPQAAPQSDTATPMLFGSFDVASLDFSALDVTKSLAPAAVHEEQRTAPVAESPSREGLSASSQLTSKLTETASAASSARSQRTPEEILADRSARLQRLEQQADWLKRKVASNNQRGTALCTKLEELHEQYGSASATTTAAEPSATAGVASAVTPSASLDAATTASTVAASVSTASTTTASATTSSDVAVPPTTVSASTRTPEEILAARAERLSRLEEQCSSLFSQMNRTSRFSSVLSNRLEELHEHYGQDAANTAPVPPVPPPMPGVLPAARLPVSEPPPGAAPEEQREEGGPR